MPVSESNFLTRVCLLLFAFIRVYSRFKLTCQRCVPRPCRRDHKEQSRNNFRTFPCIEIPTRNVSDGFHTTPRFLADAFWSCAFRLGLEARHILCRWREPPDDKKTLRLRPEGPTLPALCRPSGPEIPYVRIPVAHATGIGFVGPPGLKNRNFKTDASGCDRRNLFRDCCEARRIVR